MENNDIMTFIKNNLNHDFEHDFNYLMKELVHYQNLRGGEEIVKEIIKLVKTELGPAGEKRLQENIKKSFDLRIKQFNEAVRLLKENKREDAQNILVKLIDTFPVKKTDDDVIPLYNFQNIMESIIYTKMVAPNTKKIRQINEPIAGYYFHLAVILFEEKDYEESIKMLNYVLSYNPVYVEGLLLKAEAQLQLGYTNLFLDNINLALKYAYTKVHLAKIYFLLGKYYVELGNKSLGLALLVVSKHYDKTPFVDQMIHKATMLPGEFVRFDHPTDLTDQFNQANIQFGPNKTLIEVLNYCVKDAKEKKRTDMIKYFLNILVQLTDDAQLKQELEELK